jgi:hypothetical protein
MTESASVWLGIIAMYGLLLGTFAWYMRRLRRSMPWRCPTCRRREWGPGFCRRDGSKLIENPAAVQPTCPRCNYALSRRDRYCRHCGDAVRAGHEPETVKSTP